MVSFPIIVLVGAWLPNTASTRETVQGVAGQGGHDVRVADGEGEVGVSNRQRSYKLIMRYPVDCS